MSTCTLAPEGWFCTRETDHDGPCAAWPRRSPSVRDALALVHTMLIRHVPDKDYPDAIAAWETLDDATIESRVAESMHAPSAPVYFPTPYVTPPSTPIVIRESPGSGLIDRINRLMRWAKSHPGYWD